MKDKVEDHLESNMSYTLNRTHVALENKDMRVIARAIKHLREVGWKDKDIATALRIPTAAMIRRIHAIFG